MRVRDNYYFKSDAHANLFFDFLEKAGRENHIDREYEPFLYLLSAVGKPYLDKYITTSGILIPELKKTIKPFSHSEEALIRAGIQMFNSDLDDISIFDAFYQLDGENTKVLMNAIKIRFQG